MIRIFFRKVYNLIFSLNEKCSPLKRTRKHFENTISTNIQNFARKTIKPPLKSENQSEPVPEEDAILDLVVERLALGVDGQQVLEVLVEGEVGVDPVAEGELLLEAHRVGGADAGGRRDAAQRLQVLLLRYHLLEARARVAGAQLLAQLLELLEAQPAALLRPPLVVVLLDHPAHLVARHLEAALVQRVPQLSQVDEAVAILIDLRG